jgi:hypothetical protein
VTATTGAPEADDDEPDFKKSVTDAATETGVRIALLRADKSTTSVSWSGSSLEYQSDKYFSARDSFNWVLGGGGAGFEGAIGGSIAGGLRVPFDDRQGLVVRIGFEGYVMGNKDLYASMLELPQGQLGYQYLAGRTLFEIGAKTGAVLTGRYRDPLADETRKMGPSIEGGAYGSIHFSPVRLDGSFTRVAVHNDDLGTPIDVATGAVCGLGRWFAVCADGRLEKGDVFASNGVASKFQSTYGGVMIGFGWRRDERSKRKPEEHKHGVARLAQVLF